MGDKKLNINTKSHLNKLAGSQELADLFHDICLLMCDTEDKHALGAMNVIDCRINKLTGSIYRPITNIELAYKLVELKNQIIKTAEEAYNKGKSDGKNLLVLLNKGQITINELES